ncbi:hypothetical protein TSUD_348680 [Trifolium subterraneum]|uniref:Uncharacterized protein n=1 Tax=Trifolium subterraneum TaxID=3900 RepID=A0A2Z6NB21_TRISU|nr:hypothetical protein TSUD_348680 [Trifolium subterraneum]
MNGGGGNFPPSQSNGGDFLLSLLQKPRPPQPSSTPPQQSVTIDPAVAMMGPTIPFSTSQYQSNGHDHLNLHPLHHHLHQNQNLPPWSHTPSSSYPQNSFGSTEQIRVPPGFGNNVRGTGYGGTEVGDGELYSKRENVRLGFGERSDIRNNVGHELRLPDQLDNPGPPSGSELHSDYVDVDAIGEQIADSLLLEEELDDKSTNATKRHGPKEKDARFSDSRGKQLLSQRARTFKRQMMCRRDIDSLSVPFLSIFESLIPPEEEKLKQKQLLGLLEKLVCKEWPMARLYLYGSCANSFGVSKSDIDVCLAIQEADMDKSKIIMKLADILQSDNLQNVQLCRSCGRASPFSSGAGAWFLCFSNIFCFRFFGVVHLMIIPFLFAAPKMYPIGLGQTGVSGAANPSSAVLLVALTRARVPIVKLMDPVTGISCDICINNLLAVVNTKLLRDYANIDSRLRQLAFIIKHWAKSRGVNETYHGTLSSYAYVLMCIHFLQQRRPAILPCLQGMDPTYSVTVDNVDCAFFDKVEKLGHFGRHNKETIAHLVWGFFYYWAYCHDYANSVISVRTGSTISKRDKDWTRRVGNDRHLICIEDPFEISHDLGRVVDKHSIKVLREEFERAADIMQYDPNPCVKLFEPYVRSS